MPSTTPFQHICLLRRFFYDVLMEWWLILIPFPIVSAVISCPQVLRWPQYMLTIYYILWLCFEALFVGSLLNGKIVTLLCRRPNHTYLTDRFRKSLFSTSVLALVLGAIQRYTATTSAHAQIWALLKWGRPSYIFDQQIARKSLILNICVCIMEEK